ncbi:MAG: iron-containing alcohol dehydrogenase [Christensenellales bacterium]
MKDWDISNGLEIVCKCAKVHGSITKRALVYDDAILDLVNECKKLLSDGWVAVCYQQNCTQYADKVATLLTNGGYMVHKVCFADDTVACEENAIDLIQMQEMVRLIISVGGGSVARLARYASTIRHNPCVHVMTCTTTADILATTCFGDHSVNPPSIVVFDSKFARQPSAMLAAGYGEICSWVLRLLDIEWAIKVGENNSCPYVVQQIGEIVGEYIEEFKYCENKEVLTAKTLLIIGLLQQMIDREITSCDRCVQLLEGVEDVEPTPWGVKAMISAVTTLNWYKSALKSPTKSMLVGLDKNSVIVEACHDFGLDVIKLMAEVGKLKYKKQWNWMLREYVDDLADQVLLAHTTLMRCIRQFRRTFDDAGYFLAEYIDSTRLLKIAKTSLILSPRYSIPVLLAEEGIVLN